jgi:putative flippase GtrA
MRYSSASALALALDFIIYSALIAATIRPSSAGAMGYAAGIGLHYFLSVRFVFDVGATSKVHGRLFLEFALTGLSGIAITAIVIALATDVVGLSALLAKVLAAGASFLVVFALRRSVVFTASGDRVSRRPPPAELPIKHAHERIARPASGGNLSRGGGGQLVRAASS